MKLLSRDVLTGALAVLLLIELASAQPARADEQESVRHLYVAKLLLQRFEPLDLTAEQRDDYDRLSASLREEIDTKRSAVGIGRVEVRRRDDVYGTLKNAGKDTKTDAFWREFQVKSGFREAQVQVFRETPARYARFRSDAIALLTDEQRETLKKQLRERSNSTDTFVGDWALVMPDGAAGWLTIAKSDAGWQGELWTVGFPSGTKDMRVEGDTLRFTRMCSFGEPDYPGGRPGGEKMAVPHRATVKGKKLHVVMECPLPNGSTDERLFQGKRLPPMPSTPDLDAVAYGKPIELFNGQDLTGWTLTNPAQINGWKAIGGELVNETPKTSFESFGRYGNLRTEREFKDFNLTLEFNVPAGGNSGVYVRGMYEAQVVDRESRMQGIQGVGAVFGRVAPSENAGLPGGEWQSYDITLVDRHMTVKLNGVTVIDNAPIRGMTKGALSADVTKPGPIYLQGDHTAVRYRNIVLTPIKASK